MAKNYGSNQPLMENGSGRRKISEAVSFILGLGAVAALILVLSKDKMLSVIYLSLPPKEAGLMAGMILGDKSGFSREFTVQLQNSGLIHLVVVSGTNIILIARNIIENLAKYWGRKKTIGLTLVILWSYAQMSGWQVPVVRALLLVSLMYWAQVMGRKYNIWRSLVLTGGIMIAADWQVVGEASFWLSFLAFFAVITEKRIRVRGVKIKNMRVKRCLEAAGEGLWVSLWIWPVLGLVFGRVSPAGILGNVLVLFLVETVTLAGGAGMLLGSWWPAAGKLLLWLVWPLLKYFSTVVELLGQDQLSIKAQWGWAATAGWYLGLIWLLIRSKKHEKKNYLSH